MLEYLAQKLRSPFAVLLLLLTSPAWSLPQFQTDVYSELADGDGVFDQFPFSAPTPNFDNTLATGGTSGVGASASAKVGSGIRSVKAKASVSGASALILSAYTRINTSYRDTFTMSALGFDGQPVASGMFTAMAVLTGVAQASGGGLYSSLARVGGR